MFPRKPPREADHQTDLPHGEPDRGPLQRGITIVVALAVFAVAAGLAGRMFLPAQRSFGDSPEHQQVEILLGLAERPIAELSSGSASIRSALISYEQCDQSACEVVEVGSHDSVDALTVPIGSPFAVEGSATSVHATLCRVGDSCSNEEEDLESFDAASLFQRDPGQYSLEVDANWELEGMTVRAEFAQEVTLVENGGVGRASGADAPIVAEVVCTEHGIRVETPVVGVQLDGLHVHVTGDGATPKVVEIRPENGGSITLEFDKTQSGLDSTTTLLASPGLATVACFDAGSGGSDQEFVPMEIVDTGETWHTDSLSCPGGDDVQNTGGFWFYERANATASGIARSVPGVLPSDELSYGGFPNMGFSRWRVIRDGHVVAIMDLSLYDERAFIVSLFACQSSSVGVDSAPLSGAAATPFRLDSYPYCDPYVTACKSIFVSEQWYADHAGGLSREYAVAAVPWAECNKSQPEGCAPEPSHAILEVMLAPEDAASFVEAESCGLSRSTAC